MYHICIGLPPAHICWEASKKPGSFCIVCTAPRHVALVGYMEGCLLRADRIHPAGRIWRGLYAQCSSAYASAATLEDSAPLWHYNINSIHENGDGAQGERLCGLPELACFSRDCSAGPGIGLPLEERCVQHPILFDHVMQHMHQHSMP